MVGTDVAGPTRARHACAGEGAPPRLDILGNAQRRIFVACRAEQPTQPRSVDVENCEQFGSMSGPQPGPSQRARSVVIAVHVYRSVCAVRVGDLPYDRCEREVASQFNTSSGFRIRGYAAVIRSRSADSTVDSSSSILGSFVGSSFRKRVNSLASSALLPTTRGTRCAFPKRNESIGSSGR